MYKNYNTNFLINRINNFFKKKKVRRRKKSSNVNEISREFQQVKKPEWNCWMDKEGGRKRKRLHSRLMARNIGEKCKLPLVAHRLRSNWKHASSPARGLGASLPVPVHFRHDWHRCARPKITRSSFNIVSFPFSSKYKFYPNKYLESIIFDRLIPFNQGKGIY